jgi:hypothetical protein
MNRLRTIGMPIMVVLVIVMLATLGISPGMTCGKQERGGEAGTFLVGGREYKVAGPELWEYHAYLALQNYVLPEPPPWKFPMELFNRPDPDFRDYRAEVEDLWTFIILDKVAERAGIPASEALVADWIKRNFTTREGVYDRDIYLRFVSRFAQVFPTPKDFERILAKYLRVKYMMSLYDGLTIPSSEVVFETWKARNKRHDVDYVAQSVAEILGQIDPKAFTEDEVLKYYAQEEVRRRFLIPTRRSFDAAYLAPGALSDAEFTALRERAAAKNLGAFSEVDAEQYFYANQNEYPIQPIRDRLRKEWEERKREREAAEKPPEKPADAGAGEPAGETPPAEPVKPDDAEKPAGEPTDAPGDEKPAEPAGETGPGGKAEPPVAPADGGGAEDPAAPAEGEGAEPPAAPADGGGAEAPAAPAGDGGEAAPVEPAKPTVNDEPFDDPQELKPMERYQRFFKARVERDLFANRLLGRLLADERIDRRGLEEVARDFGLSYFRTAEPLDQYQVLELPTIGSQRLREAINLARAGEGAVYAEEPCVSGSGEARVVVVFCVTDVVKERYPDPSERIDLARLRELTVGTLGATKPDELKELTAPELLKKAFPDAVVEEGSDVTVGDVVRHMRRQSRAEELAVEKLDAVRQLVLGGNQTFEAAALEKGYRVQSVLGLSSGMTVPVDFVAPEGGSLTAEQTARNRERSDRRFLISGRQAGEGAVLSLIDRTAPEHFLDQVLTDKASQSAFLVYVRAHRSPEVEEMPETAEEEIRTDMFLSRTRRSLRALFEFEQIVERYRLNVPGVTDRKPAEK